jgi:prolyl-tRNA synthetase
MKDAYSFDRDAEGLQASYEKFIDAYDAICDRVGLEWYRVESDVGMMGGSGAHEYMAPCPAGENDVALAPGYAANTEVASADPQPVRATCTRRERRRSPPSPTRWASRRATCSRPIRWSPSRAAWSWPSCAATTASTTSS